MWPSFTSISAAPGAESVSAELNRTVAERLAIVLRLVGWDTDTYPSFGADPQALINEQIGDMERYDLFVGTFWNRLGTPTPRASSGTAEEFGRAATSYQEHGRPAIWLYFSSAPASFDTRAKLAQKDALLEFKDQLRRRALTRDYSSPSDFERQFREDLSRWLNNRPEGGRQADQGSGRQVSVPSTARKASSRPNIRDTAQAAPPAPDEPVVSSSGTLVLLAGNFFTSQSVSHRSNGRIVVRVLPSNSEETAALERLRPDGFRRGEDIAFAYQDDGRNMRVETVNSESVQGVTTFTVELTDAAEDRSTFLDDMAVNNYSSDEVAEIRAHLLLVGKPPSDVPRRDLDVLRPFLGIDLTLDDGAILPRLVRELKLPSSEFLPRARLAAVYTLKTTRTVEQILGLTVGPMLQGSISISFRGRRRQRYNNREPPVLEVRGVCAIPSV